MEQQLLQRVLQKLASAEDLIAEVQTELRLGLAQSSVTTSTATASPTSLPANDSPRLAWGKKVSPAFKKFVWQMAIDFKVGPSTQDGANWFMACMAFETIETFKPDIRPRRKDGTLVSSAVGLIQFLEKTAKSLGTTTAELAAMSAEKQLEYVWLYFRDFLKATKKPLRTLTDVYMAIHWPAAVGLPEEATMYVEGSREYFANRGLDLDSNGIITKAEAGRLVAAKLEKGLKEEYCG